MRYLSPQNEYISDEDSACIKNGFNIKNDLFVSIQTKVIRFFRRTVTWRMFALEPFSFQKINKKNYSNNQKPLKPRIRAITKTSGPLPLFSLQNHDKFHFNHHSQP